MRYKTALLLSLVVASSVVLAAQQEFARLLRKRRTGDIGSVFGGRPVDLAAKTLVDEFGVAINVEDPVYIYRDDVQDIGVTRSGTRMLIPRASLLEMAVPT